MATLIAATVIIEIYEWNEYYISYFICRIQNKQIIYYSHANGVIYCWIFFTLARRGLVPVTCYPPDHSWVFHSSFFKILVILWNTSLWCPVPWPLAALPGPRFYRYGPASRLSPRPSGTRPSLTRKSFRSVPHVISRYSTWVPYYSISYPAKSFMAFR